MKRRRASGGDEAAWAVSTVSTMPVGVGRATAWVAGRVERATAWVAGRVDA